jgi:hypothetical protein
MTFGAALAGALAAAHLSLAASPAHVSLVPGGRQAVHVTASGVGALHVEARVAGFALDLRGHPRVGASAPGVPLLRVTPPRITVGRRGADVVISSPRTPGARAGDHSAVLLLSAVAPPGGLRARMRVGVVVSVRVPGPIVHELGLAAIRARRSTHSRWMEIIVVNRGNVIERGARISATLAQGARVVARLRPSRRTILPHAQALYRLPYRPNLSGATTLRVELALPGAPGVDRSVRLRL